MSRDMGLKKRIGIILIWCIFTVLIMTKSPAAWFLFIASAALIFISRSKFFFTVGYDLTCLEVMSIMLFGLADYFGLYDISNPVWEWLVHNVFWDILLLMMLVFRVKVLKKRRIAVIMRAITLVIMLSATAICVYSGLSTRNIYRDGVYTSGTKADVDELKDGDKIIIRSSYDTSLALSTIVGDYPVFDKLDYSLYQVFRLKKEGDGLFSFRTSNGMYLCAWCHYAFNGNKLGLGPYIDTGTMKWKFYDIAGIGQVVELGEGKLYIAIQDTAAIADTFGQSYPDYACLSEWTGNAGQLVVVEKAPDMLKRFGLLVRMMNRQKVLYALAAFEIIILFIWTIYIPVLRAVRRYKSPDGK